MLFFCCFHDNPDASGQRVMSSVKVESTVKAGALLGEGPVWEESDQTLLFVDIGGQKIHRWSPATNQIQSLETSDMVSFAVPRKSGGYVAGVGCSIVAVDWSTQAMTPLLELDSDKPNNQLNDGKVDPIGRLVAGTMGREVRPAELERKQGSLFSVDPDLKWTKHLSQVDISNGMDWSLDQRTFFYIDSLALSVDAFDYDITTGQLGNRRVIYRMEKEEGLPDGMTLDAEGCLWVACYNGGRVINIDPATGVRLRTVSLPATKTTSCCFGGPDFSDLYVTSASLGLSQSEKESQVEAGNIFKVTGLGVKGRPTWFFSG
ncbi:regucalcin [Xyrichtys novacula]|uniref:Regucalcin n=1 Tax=Xyrichtys novacula TaxID=13765 RepID=A0AAV1HSY1_XYRNO|nr:regucalcin [Xyrichtys novacula]